MGDWLNNLQNSLLSRRGNKAGAKNMRSDLTITVNLSIEKSGGDQGLPTVIDAVQKALVEMYPNAEVVVRKGFFQTVDAIVANDPSVEEDIRNIVFAARDAVLSQ